MRSECGKFSHQLCYLLDLEFLTLRERKIGRAWRRVVTRILQGENYMRTIMRLYNGNFPTDNSYHLRISFTFSIEFLLIFILILSNVCSHSFTKIKITFGIHKGDLSRFNILLHLC